MPLTSTQKVEARFALTPFLFNFNSGNPTTDQASLDALVLDAIEDADAEMQYRLQSNYNPADVNAARMQATAQAYLAGDYLLLILRAQKAYGTHAPLLSEDSDAYERLEAGGMREIAEGMLQPWISIGEEEKGKGFARPVCIVSGPGDEHLRDEDRQLEILVDDARGYVGPVFPTVRS
jgi:hypothetical protein